MKSDQELFEAAVALPVDQRSAYLDGVCAGEPEKRARIAALLTSHDPTRFMVTDGIEGYSVRTGTGPTHVHPEYRGQRVGRYRLIQQLGEGGFGVVWLAEQVEPVTRFVALKIIKAGMDTREVITRFEAERQALAMMDHPNIAKVHDAGATATGRPFFVMEFVKGISITRFCDEEAMDVRQRLEVFGHICSAINHAHQKGVIHRDIKPSNVLVARHGDTAVPKIIDFGIAKAIQDKLTEHTLSTQGDRCLGTPAYMSPEQTGIAGIDIDTRSDIYSLGILLYELLTGRPPFEATVLAGAGLEEMKRIIREVEPAKPSARLRTTSLDERVGLAKTRQTSPEKLASLIEGDLDWIVMKAIEKDRGRRYETANGLGLDIQRFLTDETVSATPPTTGYRIRKFARRNKTSLRAAGAVALGLSAAAILSTGHAAGLTLLIVSATVATWLAVRATQAEKLANRRIDGERTLREEAVAVADFMADIFTNPDPSRDGKAVSVAELLELAALKLETTLASQPGRKAILYGVLGRAYHSLGLYREAIQLLESGKQCMQHTYGFRHWNSINSMRDLAFSYQAAGRRGEAQELLEDVFQRNRELKGITDAETLESLIDLGEACHLADRPAKALKVRKTAVTLLRRSRGVEDSMTIAATHRLAASYLSVDEMAGEALKLEEPALELRDAARNNSPFA